MWWCVNTHILSAAAGTEIEPPLPERGDLPL